MIRLIKFGDVFHFAKRASKCLEILPKIEKYFQKQKSTSKNTVILPKT
jgi:hypothetical protein